VKYRDCCSVQRTFGAPRGQAKVSISLDRSAE
jgi:hypothetical protein